MLIAYSEVILRNVIHNLIDVIILDGGKNAVFVSYLLVLANIWFIAFCCVEKDC